MSLPPRGINYIKRVCRDLWFIYNVIKSAKRKVKQIKSKRTANVVFIYSSTALWRYQNLVILLRDDPSFDIRVWICPFKKFSVQECENLYTEADNRFSKLGIKYNNIDNERDFIKLKDSFSPDLIFYPQLYLKLYNGKIGAEDNRDCLLAYIPYFVDQTVKSWLYDLENHRALWRHYIPTKSHLKVAKKVSEYPMLNRVVVGDLRSEEFATPPASDPWKTINDGKKRKRLIWAPHFQIQPGQLSFRPEFLWVSDIMLEMAKKYADKIQIAFKPHPVLLAELYKHPDWGKERADAYYKQWEEMPNTQLADGEYVDLFKTSDAMIHNSGSFTAEYLYVDRPIAYTTRNVEEVLKPLGEFGRECMSAHQIVGTAEEIENFIVDTVFAGHDPLADRRKGVLQNVLGDNDGKTASQRIYDDLKKSLKL